MFERPLTALFGRIYFNIKTDVVSRNYMLVTIKLISYEVLCSVLILDSPYVSRRVKLTKMDLARQYTVNMFLTIV